MKKINVAELLKDCPSGMELDCALYENLYFDYVREHAIYPIVCYTVDNKGEKIITSFYWYGTHTPVDTAKCVIFPKGKTTWEGFVPPCKFKDGDIVYVKSNEQNEYIIIFKEIKNDHIHKYACLAYQRLSIDKRALCHLVDAEIMRLATEEEKQKLFQAIKDNGYKWNAETKTLEKLPKFNVGDKITDKNKFIYRITEITDKGYKLHDLKTTFITFEEADLHFVKVVDFFDINTLIPFESRVLVRSSYGDIWRPAIYGVIDSKKHYHYVVGGHYWIQCIPYEGNQHLLGKTDDCDEFYKTWK